jgi:hypothetical protein
MTSHASTHKPLRSNSQYSCHREIMLRHFFAWIVLAVWTSSAPVHAQVRLPSKSGEVDGESLPAGHVLPLLQAELITPRRNTEMFSIQTRRVLFPRHREDPKPPTDRPFDSDEQATAAARHWIDSHFGPLPEQVALKVVKVWRSSSGNDKPEYDWDIGHTIVFASYYAGVKTDRRSVVYITGRSRYTCDCDLRHFTPIAPRKEIIDAEVGKGAWVRRLEREGASVKEVQLFRTKAVGRLEYVVSRKHTHPDQRTLILAPTWIFDPDATLMVDGHSGETWRND